MMDHTLWFENKVGCKHEYDVDPVHVLFTLEWISHHQVSTPGPFHDIDSQTFPGQLVIPERRW